MCAHIQNKNAQVNTESLFDYHVSMQVIYATSGVSSINWKEAHNPILVWLHCTIAHFTYHTITVHKHMLNVYLPIVYPDLGVHQADRYWFAAAVIEEKIFWCTKSGQPTVFTTPEAHALPINSCTRWYQPFESVYGSVWVGGCHDWLWIVYCSRTFK